jgi:hypothetical protein
MGYRSLLKAIFDFLFSVYFSRCRWHGSVAILVCTSSLIWYGDGGLITLSSLSNTVASELVLSGLVLVRDKLS